MVSISFTMFFNDSFSNLFSENINSSLLATLNNKIDLTLRTLSPNNNGEFFVLIPVIEERYISYTTVFKLQDTTINYCFSIIVESASQDDLFKRIPIITDLLSEFVYHITVIDLTSDSLDYQPKFQKLIQNVLKTVDDLFSMDPLGYSYPKNSAFMELIMKLGKNAPFFFNAVLNRRKTVILADSHSEQDLVRYPWKDLIPKQDLKIQFWPDQIPFEDDFDILIIEKNLKKQCNPDWFVLDLETGIIENGTNDDILEQYFSYLTDLNKDFGSILKIYKLNPPLLYDNAIILSNFVLSDEYANKREIYLVQTPAVQKPQEVLI